MSLIVFSLSLAKIIWKTLKPFISPTCFKNQSVCHLHNDAYGFLTAYLKWRAWLSVKHIVTNAFHCVPQKTAYGAGTKWGWVNNGRMFILDEFIFKRLKMQMKVLQSFEKRSWCPQILEITLAPDVLFTCLTLNQIFCLYACISQEPTWNVRFDYF